MRTLAVSVFYQTLLICIGTALGQELTVTRTVESGVESLIAHERSWGRNCKAQQSTVTIKSKPMKGTVSVVQGTSAIPASTPRFGSTGVCAGKTITGNQVMYKSNPGIHGVDAGLTTLSMAMGAVGRRQSPST
jgi:hypothetical protein